MPRSRSSSVDKSVENELIDVFKDLILTHEGVVSHVYLDTKGNITVGKGHMVPGLLAMQKLIFYKKNTHERASEDEIRHEFETIKKQSYGISNPASFYNSITKLYLKDDEIKNLLTKDVQGTISDLKRKFSNFGSFPSSAKLALMDMMYNLGASNFSKFVELSKAVKKQDWIRVSNECDRRGISPERNEATKKLFLDSMKEVDGSSTPVKSSTDNYRDLWDIPPFPNNEDNAKLDLILKTFEEQQENARQQERWAANQDLFKAGQDAASAIAALGIYLGNRKLAKAGEITGQLITVGFNVAKLTGNVVGPALIGPSLLSPYAAIAMAGIGILGILSGGNKQDSGLADAVKAIQNSIKELSKQIAEGFETISKQINELQETVNVGFRVVLMACSNLDTLVNYRLDRIEVYLKRLLTVIHEGDRVLYESSLKNILGRLENAFLGDDKPALLLEHELLELNDNLFIGRDGGGLEVWITHKLNSPLLNGEVFLSSETNEQFLPEWINTIIGEHYFQAGNILGFIIRYLDYPGNFPEFSNQIKLISKHSPVNSYMFSNLVFSYYIPVVQILRAHNKINLRIQISIFKKISDLANNVLNIIRFLTDKGFEFLNYLFDLYDATLDEINLLVAQKFLSLRSNNTFDYTGIEERPALKKLFQDDPASISNLTAKLNLYKNLMVLLAKLSGFYSNRDLETKSLVEESIANLMSGNEIESQVVPIYQKYSIEQISPGSSVKDFLFDGNYLYISLMLKQKVDPTLYIIGRKTRQQLPILRNPPLAQPTAAANNCVVNITSENEESEGLLFTYDVRNNHIIIWKKKDWFPVWQYNHNINETPKYPTLKACMVFLPPENKYCLNISSSNEIYIFETNTGKVVQKISLVKSGSRPAYNAEKKIIIHEDSNSNQLVFRQYDVDTHTVKEIYYNITYASIFSWFKYSENQSCVSYSFSFDHYLFIGASQMTSVSDSNKTFLVYDLERKEELSALNFGRTRGLICHIFYTGQDSIGFINCFGMVFIWQFLKGSLFSMSLGGTSESLSQGNYNAAVANNSDRTVDVAGVTKDEKSIYIHRNIAASFFFGKNQKRPDFSVEKRKQHPVETSMEGVVAAMNTLSTIYKMEDAIRVKSLSEDRDDLKNTL